MLDGTTNLLRLLKDPSLQATKGYFASECVDGDGLHTFDVTIPARGDVIKQVANLSSDQVACAIAVVETGQIDWSAMTGKERSLILRKWFDLMIKNADDLATF